jgi:hypothetical protein
MKFPIVGLLLLVSGTAFASGRVVIYRPAVQLGGLFHESVYQNEKRIAKLCNGCYIELDLSPGEYSFRSKDKKRGVVLSIRDGETYYLRVGPFGGTKVSLQSATREEAKFELSRTKKGKCQTCK